MAKAYSRHKCAVEGCTSVSCKEEGVSLHRLPALASTRQAWFNTIPMPKLERPENIVICSKHFKDEDFKASVDETYKRRLKSDAVPSIFTPPELPTLQHSDSEEDGSVAGEPMSIDYDIIQVSEVDISPDYASDDPAHAVSGVEYPEPARAAVAGSGTLREALVPYCVACLASASECALQPLPPRLAAVYHALLRDVDADPATRGAGGGEGCEGHACYLCVALLRRTARLGERCRRARTLLAAVDANTPLLNPALLNAIDRKVEGLTLSLSVHREANIDTTTPGSVQIEVEPTVPLIPEDLIVGVKLEVEEAKHETRTFVPEDASMSNSLDFDDNFLPEDHIVESDVDDSDQELSKLARNKRKLKANIEKGSSKKVKTKKKFKSKSKKKHRKIKNEKCDEEVDNEKSINEPCKSNENNDTKDNSLETNGKKKRYRKQYEGENAVSERRFRFASLHMDYWDVVELTEEEALAAFKSKKDQPSYRWAKHPCKYCYVGFSMKSSLDMHMNFHSASRGALECKFCRRRFSKEGERKKHTLLHMYRYLCKRCDFKSSGRTTAKRHNQYHEGSTYTCKLCDTTFTKHSSYFGHMRFRHRSAHVCPGCGENYQSHPAARLHFRRQHPNCVWRTEPAGEQDALWCARCSLRFEDAPAFDTHLRTSAHHAHTAHTAAQPTGKAEQSKDGNNTAEAGTEDSKKEQQGHEKQDGGAEVKQECGEGQVVVEVTRLDDRGGRDALFKGKKPGRSLKRKVRASIETVCPVCGAMFRSEVQYMKHHRREHKGTRLAYRYMCDQCGQTYPSAFTLQEHETVHSGRKRHVCAVCNRGFNHSSNYKRHMVVHTGEQPHACHICDGRFTTRTGLTNHVKHIHEGVPWPRRNRHKDGLPPLDHINYYATPM